MILDHFRVSNILIRNILARRITVDSKKDDTCEYRIMRAMRRIIRAVAIHSRKLNSELGLTTPQLLCLHALSKSKKMTLTDLAKTVTLGISTVNGIIDRLETKKYLTRTRSAEDHRKVYLEISPSGYEIVSRAPSLLQHKLSSSLSQLAESEQTAITEALERVVELMEAEKLEVSPNLFSGEQSYKQ